MTTGRGKAGCKCTAVEGGIHFPSPRLSTAHPGGLPTVQVLLQKDGLLLGLHWHVCQPLKTSVVPQSFLHAHRYWRTGFRKQHPILSSLTLFQSKSNFSEDLNEKAVITEIVVRGHDQLLHPSPKAVMINPFSLVHWGCSWCWNSCWGIGAGLMDHSGWVGLCVILMEGKTMLCFSRFGWLRFSVSAPVNNIV